MPGASRKLPVPECLIKKMTKRSESVTSCEIAGFIPEAEVGTVL